MISLDERRRHHAPRTIEEITAACGDLARRGFGDAEIARICGIHIDVARRILGQRAAPKSVLQVVVPERGERVTEFRCAFRQSVRIAAAAAGRSGQLDEDLVAEILAAVPAEIA